MRLTELKPAFVGAGGPGISNSDGSPVPERTGIGLIFDCPCGKCNTRAFVAFENPLDGGVPHISKGQPTWQRIGDTFDTITLEPSILRVGGCGWHGYIRNGEIIQC